MGGYLGSLLGPWGTVAGAAVGHFAVDRKAPAVQRKQVMRLLAVAAGALHDLACCDGNYTHAKANVIRAVLKDLNATLGNPLKEADVSFLMDGATRVDHGVMRLAEMVRGHQQLGCAALSWFWQIAVCGGEPSAREEDVIDLFTVHAGIPPQDAQFVASHFVRRPAGVGGGANNRHAACDTLGVPYTATLEEVKRAYRALSQKYHPDKHADLDPDIRALTAEKFAQVKRAYDILCDE
ncbi:MAG: J domain-containing protein [Kiritimatiellaeota bacterium]|nr:J domain-containing protein [Kiritimatiellota bacterium]